MVETVISIRNARPGDEGGIARVHDAAWRDAYLGIIPGRELERMIQRRGPTWWRQAILGGTRLLVLDFADRIAGLCELRAQPHAAARLQRRDF